MTKETAGRESAPQGERHMLRRLRPYALPILLIFVLFAVILSALVLQLSSIRTGVHEDMSSHLQSNADMVSGKLDSLYTAIASVAPLMTDEFGASREERLLAMNALRDACGFDFVVRTNADGIAMNYLGAENIDLSQRDYIREALTGKRVLSYISSGAYDTENAFVVLAAPIKSGDRCVGVLHGSYAARNVATLLETISSHAHDESGLLTLMRADGTVIASRDAAAPDMAAALAGRLNAAVGETPAGLHGEVGFATLSLNGAESICYYQPLEIAAGSDWLLVSRIDGGYISRLSAPTHTGALVIFAVALAVSALLVFVTVKKQRLLAAQERQMQLLRDALATAESAGAARSQFLSNVSHEMRTPLNAIIGFLSLAEGADQQQVEAYLKNSQIAARQLVSVINDVLDMSAIESGKIKLTSTPFDFRQVIYTLTSMYVAQCRVKGILYDTRLLTPIDEWLVGDQLRLNQILINLLGNAVKFTAKGRVVLSVSQTQTQADRTFIRFEVSDTGCGMSEETIARLFTPFEQADAAVAHRYGGSGLGLSIVKNLVQMMGGAIRVESKLGEGSVFTVDLPFGRSEAHTIVPEITGVDTLRVLAVDDDKTEREYVSIVLERIGVTFKCVTSGNDALAELDRAKEARTPYNICLIDWKMPHMDGAETTRKIRGKYGKDVIVIVVSAYDYENADESARSAGANLFIPKPLFQSSLFDLFMTLTGGRVAKRETSQQLMDFTGRHLLLVEDNEMNRVVAQALIKKLGATCDTAADGQIAFDRFTASKTGQYDAILMDIQMPNVDGLRATRMIRASAHPEAHSIPIIALTANAFNEDIAKAMSCGMNAHVAKPISLPELSAALEQAFLRQIK